VGNPRYIVHCAYSRLSYFNLLLTFLASTSPTATSFRVSTSLLPDLQACKNMSDSHGSGEEEKQAFLPQEDSVQHQPKPITHSKTVWCLVILILISWSISIYLWLHQKPWPGHFSTDLKSMWPAIEYEERGFSGGLNYNPETKKIIWEMNDKEPQYFGVPNPSIDAAWANLMKGRSPELCSTLLTLFLRRVRYPYA